MLASASKKRTPSARTPRLRALRPADLQREWTYEELCSTLAESPAQIELWDGEIIVSPTPSSTHQMIVGRLYRQLAAHVESGGLGAAYLSPLDMVLSAHRTTQPDVLFVSKARFSIIERVVMGPADLVMEVISPRGRQRDRQAKRDLYEQHGIAEYWIIDPEAQTVEVLVLVKGEYRLVVRARPGELANSKLLSGFQVEVQSLFAKL